MVHTPLMDDVAVRIQALEATSEIASASITLDEIRPAQSADNSLQSVTQALKDQAQPPHSGIRQYPEDAHLPYCPNGTPWSFKKAFCIASATTLMVIQTSYRSSCWLSCVVPTYSDCMLILDTLGGRRLAWQFLAVYTFWMVVLHWSTSSQLRGV